MVFQKSLLIRDPLALDDSKFKENHDYTKKKYCSIMRSILKMGFKKFYNQNSESKKWNFDYADGVQCINLISRY
jgi:hypothetical protein